MAAGRKIQKGSMTGLCPVSMRLFEAACVQEKGSGSKQGSPSQPLVEGCTVEAD